MYKDVIERTLESDRSSYCPFRRERQMDHLFDRLSSDFGGGGIRVLDACCGYGRLLHFLNEFDGRNEYYGIDFVPELVREGQSLFKDRPNVRFETYDVMELSRKYKKYFDVTVNYKTLSWLPYYDVIMRELVAATTHRIYVTSLFYDGDIDFLTKVHSNASDDTGRYTWLNTYSLPKFQDYCLSLGAKQVRSSVMELDLDLQRPEDPNRVDTYTVRTAQGDRLEITGTTILNWRLVELVL